MFHINLTAQRVTRLSDMAVIKLTETVISLIDHFILKALPAKVLANKFDVPVHELIKDFEFMLNSLSQRGFELTRENLVSTSNFVTDLTNIWSPITPIIHIIQNCNSPCIMCDCWKIKEKVFHSIDILKPLFLDLKNKGAVRVMLSGGEPLMHPELRAIISFLQELGLGCELNTNGLLLHKNLWMLDYDIDEIVISMDAITSHGYKFIRGLNKFDLVWNNFATLKHLKPQQNVGIRVTVTKELLSDLQGAINFFLGQGVDYIGFSPLDVSSNSFSRFSNDKEKAADLTEKLLFKRSYLKNLQQLLKDKNSALSIYLDKSYISQKISWPALGFLNCIEYYLNENSEYINSQNMCIFPLTSLVLDYNGDLKNCFYSQAFGNIYKYDDIDWRATAALHNLVMEDKCVDCRGKVFCG